MKIICVIQRYGLDIAGGAEFHCRLVAEHLAVEHEVEIVTTTARNYITWENEFPEGTTEVNGLKVHRFIVEPLNRGFYDDLAYRVLYQSAGPSDQKTYVRMHGPYCPAAIRYLESRNDVSCFIFFSYRYWITYEGIRRFGSKSILVPTAEHDRTLHVPIFQDIFTKPAAIAYNSVEEQQIIHQVMRNENVPGLVTGVGLADYKKTESKEVLSRHDLLSPYVIYVGRIERAKGCARLAGMFLKAFHDLKVDPFPELVFAGKLDMPIPQHSRIRILGAVTEDDKYGLIKNAVCLMMPSQYESLSMVVLESWRMKRPVLCNGDCEVLRGQCNRSGGGLYYRNADEFTEALYFFIQRPDLAGRMGIQGFNYYQSNYPWEVILQKYHEMLSWIVPGN